jgi:nitrogen fixation protein NifT
MAKIMLRENNKGEVLFYVAKKDMEEVIEKIEFDTDEKWGGEILLKNGDLWYIKPMPKKLPTQVNAKLVRRN